MSESVEIDNAFTNNTDSAGIPISVLLTIRIVFTILYCIIIVFALVGNAIVCYLVVHDFKSSVTNMFLFNLSLVDILNVLFCVPITLMADNWYNYWPFGSVLCKVVPYVMAMSVFLSALTHVTISCDRFVVVNYPLRPRMPRRVAIYVVIGIWVFAFIVALPIPIVQKYVMQAEGPQCEEHWSIITGVYNATNGTTPEMRASLIYTVIVFFLQYVLPLLILTGTYTVIVAKLWAKKPPGEMDERRDQRIVKSKKKMVKMVIIVASLYAVSQLPRNVIFILGLLQPSLWNIKGSQMMWIACHLVAVSGTCYNPVIYCWMNKNFRYGFARVLRPVFPCCLNNDQRWRTSEYKAIRSQMTYMRKEDPRQQMSNFSSSVRRASSKKTMNTNSSL